MFGKSEEVGGNCLCFRKQYVRTQHELYDEHLDDKQLKEVVRAKYVDKIIRNGYQEPQKEE